ncbi:MAG: hypothetical protein V7727_20735 [Sneathiella sp.]
MRKTLIFGAVALLFSANAHAENSKWQQLDNIPDCRVWNELPEPNEFATWSGACRDGHAEGEGVLAWHAPIKETISHHVYVGHMHRGKLHGHGVYTWPDGSRYEGMWNRDNRHGNGVYTQPDGARYDGQWKNDYWHGMGTTFDTFGHKIYAGDWIVGQRSGYGIETFNCPQNMPDGIASMILKISACGMTYDGNWKDGLPNGEGTLITPYLGSYSGNWTNGCLKKFYVLNLTFGVDSETCK